jgi:glycogen(starch) synthase
MRLCLITDEYPPETELGGIGTYSYMLANTLAKMGVVVHVISVSKKKESISLVNGVYIHRIFPKLPVIPRRITNFIINKEILKPIPRLLAQSYSFFKEIKKIHKYNKVDIIEAPEWMAQGFFLSIFKIAPLIVKLHTYKSIILRESNKKPSIIDKIFCEFEKRTLHRADGIISNTKSLLLNCVHDYLLPKKTFRVISYGIDTNSFKPQKNNVKCKLGLSNKFVILFVGRIEKRKGVELLINVMNDIFKKFSNCILLIVGSDRKDGPNKTSYITYLLKLAANLKIDDKIVYLGKIPNKKLPEYYSLADIFVAPSGGIVFLEAMSCELPIVGSNKGVGRGIPDDVFKEDYTGYYVPFGNTDKMVQIIIKLIENESLRLQMGKEARSYIMRNFTSTIIGRNTLQFYQSILNRKNVD